MVGPRSVVMNIHVSFTSSTRGSSDRVRNTTGTSVPAGAPPLVATYTPTASLKFTGSKAIVLGEITTARASSADSTPISTWTVALGASPNRTVADTAPSPGGVPRGRQVASMEDPGRTSRKGADGRSAAIRQAKT
eukprot:CAMPEP_0194314440 /NCGR_PEP_ID=MMETSP0171-20130528/11293_1 /TAXON_ID=218684 /ORGANISM="Corethron pennatum, Strain L29A3" /LENGTH=134 /DNA_ID=CAMNT_0039069857 /DNA_START=244 /DNA_END=648 /DNA_ORIENTATION=-